MEQQNTRKAARNFILIALLSCNSAISEQDLQALLSRIFGWARSFPDMQPYIGRSEPKDGS
jgi:hypothetical protein